MGGGWCDEREPLDEAGEPGSDGGSGTTWAAVGDFGRDAGDWEEWLIEGGSRLTLLGDEPPFFIEMPIEDQTLVYPILSEKG
jgi:hypothetical protein